MPRKTRKQKQQAAKRRAAQSSFQAQDKGLAPNSFEDKFSGLVKGEFKFEPEGFSRAHKRKKTVKKVDKSFLLGSPELVVRDLAKTVLLALALFSLEIVVYLVWFK